MRTGRLSKGQCPSLVNSDNATMHKPCMKYAFCIHVFENIKNTNQLRVHRCAIVHCKCTLAGRLSKGHDKAMCLHFKQSGGCALQSGNVHA